jgi:hypothetical protein
MKTTKYVVDQIYGLLSARPLFKHKHPDGITQSAFTVINTLGVPVDPIQDVEVNVNCYAKDTDTTKGVPDLATLETMQGDVINELHDYNNAEFDIELQRAVMIREETLKMHFINLRFKLTFLNN